MLRFIKTTVLGGVMFLVPIVIFFVIIGKAIKLVHQLATPLSKLVPVETIGGLAIVELVSIAILVLICFLAGLAARSRRAHELVRALERNVLDKVPAYALMKAKTGSMLSPEEAQDMLPVLVQFDDSWQIGLEVERIDESRSLIFLPGAPDPWSGSVCAVTTDRICPLQTNIKEVVAAMKRLGKGSTQVLRGVQ